MHKFLAALLIASTAIGAFSAPAYADRISVSIGDGHRDHRGHWNNRGHRDRRDNRGHSRHYSHYRSRPIIVSSTYVTPYYAPAAYYPAQTPVVQNNGYCREYNGPANVGGRVVQTYGTACLMPDGSWQIVD